MDRPPVVILSGVRWDFLWQRHHALATLFARAGYPTVFVETTGLANPSPRRATLRKVASRIRHATGKKPSTQKGPTVYAPLAAPPTYKVFRWLNRSFFVPRVVRDLEEIAGPDPVVLAYPPTRTTLDLISRLRPRLVFYDCSDDYAHFPGAPKDIADTERELLRRADLVSCTSTHLLERVRSLRPDAFLSGPAVDYERFAVLQEARSGKDVRTVCFFGHVSRERIDFSALRAVAEAGFDVRIAGGLGRVERGFLELPGVDYRGEVPHAELPASLSGVDAFVLPYRVNGLTRGISPAKIYECLATGRPVVAAPLPALEELAGHVYLAQRPEDYVEVLRNLEGLETEEKRRARIELARKNSWEARFGEIEEALWRVL
ncbi:MAG: glycosyltransferase [Actinobacteria bacterium]|nr:glycosyltransferase [Actinomycetota bacterium]